MIRSKLKALIGDAQGATAIEYGLICGLIVIGMLAGLNAVAGQNGSGYSILETRVHDAVQNSTG